MSDKVFVVTSVHGVFSKALSTKYVKKLTPELPETFCAKKERKKERKKKSVFRFFPLSLIMIRCRISASCCKYAKNPHCSNRKIKVLLSEKEEVDSVVSVVPHQWHCHAEVTPEKIL